MKTAKSKQWDLLKQIYRHYAVIAFLLVGALFVTQFVVLATLGTKGNEVTSLRNQKQELRQEIETIRAEIDDARTLAEIEDDISVVYSNNVRTVNPTPLDNINNLNDSALGLADE